MKYLCLANSGVDATSLSENSTTKPTNKDGMSLPLPWCAVDRVGAIASNDTVSGETGAFIIGINGHEPPPISVSAQANFNWEPSHF